MRVNTKSYCLSSSPSFGLKMLHNFTVSSATWITIFSRGRGDVRDQRAGQRDDGMLATAKATEQQC